MNPATGKRRKDILLGHTHVLTNGNGFVSNVGSTTGLNIASGSCTWTPVTVPNTAGDVPWGYPPIQTFPPIYTPPPPLVVPPLTPEQIEDLKREWQRLFTPESKQEKPRRMLRCIK